MRIGKWISMQTSATMIALFTFSMIMSINAPAQEERFQRSFDVNKGATLIVDNRKGTVHIKGSDSSQVIVSVYKHFSGPDKAKTNWLNETAINFSTDSMHPKVQVNYPDHDCGSDSCDDGADLSDVEITIQVPRQINLELSGRKPDIVVSSIEGNISIQSHKSPITIESTQGAIHIVSHSNNVKLKDVSIVGKLDVNIENGTAEIQARSLGQEADLETTKGSIVVHVPKNAGANVDFSGGSRSVFLSDFPMGQSSGRAIREIHGTINQGGTRMRLRTDKGSISLRKSSNLI